MAFPYESYRLWCVNYRFATLSIWYWILIEPHEIIIIIISEVQFEKKLDWKQNRLMIYFLSQTWAPFDSILYSLHLETSIEHLLPLQILQLVPLPMAIGPIKILLKKQYNIKRKTIKTRTLKTSELTEISIINWTFKRTQIRKRNALKSVDHAAFFAQSTNYL